MNSFLRRRASEYSPNPSLECRSFSERCPTCPPEVVVKYPDGVHTVVRRSDFHKSEFAKDDDPSSKGYVRPKDPNCRLWVKIAVERTLFDGSDSYYSEFFRKALIEDCGGIEIDVGESKKGSTGTSKVQD